MCSSVARVIARAGGGASARPTDGAGRRAWPPDRAPGTRKNPRVARKNFAERAAPGRRSAGVTLILARIERRATGGAVAPVVHLRLSIAGGAPMFRSFVLSVTLCAAALVLGAVPAAAQSQSRCADCHFANPGSVSASHLAEWDLSAHGRQNVGCETCHGGDARSFETFVAHKDILARTNPASPVHRTNLPKTCGTCHTGPFVAFQTQQALRAAAGQRQERADLHDLPRRSGRRAALAQGARRAVRVVPRRRQDRAAPRVPRARPAGRRGPARDAGAAEGRAQRHLPGEGPGAPQVARVRGAAGGGADHRGHASRPCVRVRPARRARGDGPGAAHGALRAGVQP